MFYIYLFLYSCISDIKILILSTHSSIRLLNEKIPWNHWIKWYTRTCTQDAVQSYVRKSALHIFMEKKSMVLRLDAVGIVAAIVPRSLDAYKGGGSPIIGKARMEMDGKKRRRVAEKFER